VTDDPAGAHDPAHDPADDGAGAADTAEPRPVPPPSGIDLGRSLLAQARTDSRARGRAVQDKRAVRTGDVDRQRRSGAGPDDRDPQLLGDTVDRMVVDRGWQAQAAVGGVVARWPHVVGPELADHCVPEGYAATVLTVRADSTAWATQVRLLAPTLVARLNAECGDGTVTQVNVLGPGGPSWRKGALRVPGRGPRDTYG
jgi:predicted nucleic acid-binding Zn ribbon protein